MNGIERVERADGVYLITSRGRAVVREEDDVLVVVYTGVIEEALVQPVTAEVARLLPPASTWVFNDAYELQGYETGVRQHFVEWVESGALGDRQVGVLLRSKLVAMGVSVANMLLGGRLKPFSSRAKFEAAIAEARHQAGAA